jgi:hypothetical protein
MMYLPLTVITLRKDFPKAKSGEMQFVASYFI